ncbi:rhotekin-2-like [Artemia franciscana]|uniref:rhotekin-2-like n=1 Tax=Artemia franciscana TaxID=6661 RepID=UPI0032DBD16E
MAPIKKRKSEDQNDSFKFGTFGKQKLGKGTPVLKDSGNTMGTYTVSKEHFEGISPEALEAAKHVQMAKLRQSRALDASDEISNLSAERQQVFGKFAISDLRVPLVWNENHSHRYAAFCVVICGEYCIASDIVWPIDRRQPDIPFEKPLILEKVTPDFDSVLQIFVADLGLDSNLVSVRKRLHQTIRSSFRGSSTLKKKFDRSIEFKLVASSKFVLDDCQGDSVSYDLTIESEILPLFGHICCKLSVRPYCLGDIIESRKTVHYFEKKTKIKLSGFQVKILKDRQDMTSFCITEDTSVRVGQVNKNEIVISNGESTPFTLMFKSPDEYQEWLSIFLERVILAKRWKKAAKQPMLIPDIKEPTTPLPSGMALYEATPIQLNKRQIRPIMEVFGDQSTSTLSSTTSLASLGSTYCPKSGSLLSLQPKLRRRGTLSGWGSTRSFLRFSR